MTTKTGLRLRAKVDYIGFVVKHEWPFMLALVGVLLGVGEFLPSAAALALSLVAVALGVFQFVVDYRDMNKRWSEYRFEPATDPFPVADIAMPDSYSEPVRHVVPGRGTAVSDDAIDRRLRTTSLTAVVDSDAYQLPASLRATAPQVLGPTVGSGVVFNGHVLGMSDDPAGVIGARPIRLHRARFFDGQCSNELCRLRIKHRTSGELYDMRRQTLIDPTGRLAPLSGTELANIVGISTMAVTTDGQVVLIEQSRRNSASAALLAPSGSGSLEPRDLDDLGTGWSLQDLLIRGMNRELAEETGLAESDIDHTTIVGYARWLERGAKPEFFGHTRLRVSSAEVRAAVVRGAEQLYTSDSVLLDVDLEALGTEIHAGHDVLTAPSCPALVRERGSVPLVLGLRAVAAAVVSPLQA